MNHEDKERWEQALIIGIICGIAYFITGPIGLGIIALYYLIRRRR